MIVGLNGFLASAGPETAEKGAGPAVVEKKAVPKAKKGATRKERPPGAGMVRTTHSRKRH